MREQDYQITIDDNRMSVVLLQIIKKKNLVNESTFKAVLDIYKKRIKGVA